MPLAVTHVLTSVILVDLFRDYILKNKKYLTLHAVLIAGIAGLLPDIDIPINWILGSFGYTFEIMKHGGLTHTPMFGIIFLIPGLIFLRYKKYKPATYLLVISAGIFTHIFLDYFLGGGRFEGIMLFWPLTSVPYKLHLLNFIGLSNIPQGLDAIVLIVWLWHEEVKHKIKDFI
ncbi:MAG: metal-dependent hydrolase [Nanoarchaeota archaeon]